MISEFKIYKNIKPLLRPYPWSIPLIVTLGCLSSIMEGIGIGLFIPLINTLANTKNFIKTDNYILDWFNGLFENIPPDRRLYTIVAFIFFSITFKALLYYVNRIVFEWFNSRFSHRLRTRIFDQVLKVNYRFLENNRYGNLFNILTTETWRTGSALSTLINLVIILFNIVVYLTMMLIISWRLTVIVGAAMVIISIIVRSITYRVKEFGKLATSANAKLANLIIEGVAGMKIIRAFGREIYEKNRFEKSSKNLSNIFLKLGMISEIVKPVYEILAALLLVAIMLITLQNPKNLSLFLTFIFILYRLQPKVNAFDSYRVALRSLSPAVEETSSVLYISKDDHTISPKVPFKGLNRGINFDNITFYYNPFEKPTISNLSMSITAGKTTAVIGPSGAGKTTLTKLILRLYDPSEGKILIDDVPLDEIDLTLWRQRIALVSQDVFLFNTSVYNNIAYGSSQAKKEDVYNASKLADAHSFICKLPKGYESIVGDRGAWLSGGQQQRIALARALVRDPDILILDEATNALDGISIQLINTALANYKKNRTVIIIAHRFTSFMGVDHIIVMQDGCICEQGKLQSLLDSDGLFARLYGLELRNSGEQQN